MNGTYAPIETYIPNTKEKILTYVKSIKENPNKKVFQDKYCDKIINFLINTFKNMNFDTIKANLSVEEFNIQYHILAQDIINLDPKDPYRSDLTLDSIIKECCETIGLEFIDSKITGQSSDKATMYIIIIIKNPFKKYLA